MGQIKIPIVVMRGGTSRAVIFREGVLPAEPEARDRILRAALGSPDPFGKQTDGLGGGVSSTSKAAIIGPSRMPGADVDYTFAQVGVTDDVVDYKANCGNISSAVGPYAIDEGLVPATGPETIVRIFNTNTRKVIVAHVPVEGGRARVEGDFRIQGVAGTGAKIALEYLDPAGAGTGRLFPTGALSEEFALPSGKTIRGTIIDVTNPLVLVRAADFGLAGTESPEAVDRDQALMRTLGFIRGTAAVRIGLAASAEEAARRSPAIPQVAFVGPPAGYRTAAGDEVSADEVDLVGRALSMGRCHKAYPSTGAMATAAAAVIEGTIAQAVLIRSLAPSSDVRLGHAGGVQPIGVRARREGAQWAIDSIVNYRTARRLAEGFIFVPESCLCVTRTN
jgi:2-methylaconitate cis-trans-isomerase PrpF